MKHILITGANSYIGTSFEKYIKENYPGDYTVDTLDMIDGSWREKSFEGYDVILHVAAYVHHKETRKNAQMYYRINTDLAIETANKARNDRAKKFILLSSMGVYGINQGVITEDTVPHPKNYYGRSKLLAETEIGKLQNDAFSVCILRLPTVYGNGCKGNFNSLCSLVKKTPIFPIVDNKRSMIYIDNVSEFIRLVIDHDFSGVYFPQNCEYVNISKMVLLISAAYGKKIYFTSNLGLLIKLFIHHSKRAKKAFGSLYYEKSMSEFIADYNVVDFEHSVFRSIKVT